MRRLAIHSALFLSFSLLSAMGCSQDEGERCQQDSDCASGLVCKGTNQGSGYIENGICKPVGSSTTTHSDAGNTDTRKTDTAPKSDATTTDAISTVETGSSADTGPEAGGTDASVVKDGPSQPRPDARLDSSARADAGVDAPAVDAPVDVVSPTDAATDGQLG